MSQTDRLISTENENWVSCVFGLKYLLKGLKGVTTRIIEKQHKNILKSLPTFEGSCKLCTLDKLLPFHQYKNSDCPYLPAQKKKCFCSKQKGRLLCPNKFCSRLFDEIVKRHRFRDPQWKNTDPTKWKECPWSIATCFINTAGYEGKNADTMDCSGTLSIIINNLDFETELGVTIDGETDNFKKARDARNDILHSSTNALTDDDFHEYINLFKGILEMPQFKSEDGGNDALHALAKIQKKELTFTFADKHEAEQDRIEEFKRLKMCMIEDIVQFLKDKKMQGRSAFVDSYNPLLRYHLLLQHASRETLINRLEREAKKQDSTVENMLTSHKENILSSLEENEIKTLFMKDGTINTNLNEMGVSLICKLILNIFDSEENKSESLTREEIDAIHYILKETEELKMQDLVVQLDRNTARQKCSQIQDYLLILSEDKTEKSTLDSGEGFKCKTLLIRYQYRIKSIDALSCLLKENVDRIDSLFLKTVNDRLAKVNYKEQPNMEDVLESQNKTLELMLKLYSCRNIGKNLNTYEVIEGQICVNCVSESLYATVNDHLLQCVLECTNDEYPSAIKGQTTLMTKLKATVSDWLPILTEITGVVLNEALRGSTILQIRCSTCEAIYNVLVVLNGPVFQDFLLEIQACLETETKEMFEVSGHVTPESLQKVKEHLIEQDAIKATGTNVTCKHHQDENVECYCPKHGQFCCKICLEISHRGCIEEVREIKIEHAIVNDVKQYNARTDTDRNECWIRASTVLENGEVLLADFGNSKLKKMNHAFQIIGHCNLPQTPTDVCYIGNGVAAVSLSNSTIQFVDIVRDLTLTYPVELDHPCYGLAESDSVIYTTDDKSVYTYNKDGTGKKLLYRDTSGNVRFRKLAVSEERETIYITNLTGSLVIIGKGGGLLATVRHPNLKRPEDVCNSDKGSVLVCDSESATVLRVKYVGKRDIQKDVVFKDFDGLKDPFSVSVDKKSQNVIVSEYKKDEIIVLPLNK